VPENRRPVAVEDVLFAGELEPRLLIPLHGSSENPAGQSGQEGLCQGSTHPMLSSLG
jgi:hypothetical protein